MCLCGSVLLFKPYLGIETLSWVCILAASPFAAFCFFKYNGMVAEKAINGDLENTYLSFSKDVMDLMTEFRKQWNFTYPEEE